MITDAYRRVLCATRDKSPTWGGARRHAAPVLAWLERLGLKYARVLDFGCGTGAFADELGKLAPGRYDVTGYDPSVPGKDELAAGSFEVVVATHVLEHVEPELLVATLAEIHARALRLVYIEVPHGPARTLADGRNAHLIQQPPMWWRDTLERAFPHAVVSHGPGQNPINTIFTVEL